MRARLGSSMSTMTMSGSGASPRAWMRTRASETRPSTRSSACSQPSSTNAATSSTTAAACSGLPPTLPTRSVLLVLRCAEQHFACLGVVVPGRRGLHVGERFQRTLHRGPRIDPVEPALYFRKLGPVDTVALAVAQPREDRDVRDRVLRPREVRLFRQALLHDAVQPPHFVAVAPDRVVDLLRHGVAAEMARLPHHRADVAHLEHHPLQRDVFTAVVARQQLAALAGE